ncbi:MAG: GH32 C-terminal domain-containing protein [Bacilli bacterium]|nr:GH32 C-terminal domain-containing protein [Bacilli bacterium]
MKNSKNISFSLLFIITSLLTACGGAKKDSSSSVSEESIPTSESSSVMESEIPSEEPISEESSSIESSDLFSEYSEVLSEDIISEFSEAYSESESEEESTPMSEIESELISEEESVVTSEEESMIFSENTSEEGDFFDPVLSFSFESTSNGYTLDNASGSKYHIDYVFNKENADILFKKPNDPLLKQGVNNKSLYMDGFSTKIRIADYDAPLNKITFSTWVAPRGFENLNRYGNETCAAGHPRMTSLFNWGHMENEEGFLFGYGRLGLWGLQMNLHSNDTGNDFFVGFYDPMNTLPLYEWSHIAATFDGETGYICLSFNGKVCYEAIIPDLVDTEIIESDQPLYFGYYCSPIYEFGIARQSPSALVDEVEIYHDVLSPKDLRFLFHKYSDGDNPPELPFSEVQLDSSVYSGDRYRPQYHGIPPAVWMNEPHAPIYYKGMFHVFYQHNPIGPYWSQIRWAHICSTDMIHWHYVKDAVAPQNPACPEGAWTGGSVIGPDGVPWLTITAGTNYADYVETSRFSHQSVCYAHPVDPTDPYLTDWKVEEVNTLVQPSDWSQGKIEEFRDPFVWYDAPYYYMMVSTSVADDWDTSHGGSTNMFRSTDMRNWEYKGFTFEVSYADYPEQGKHWECCIMLPISTEDGSLTKYIFMDSPQYTVSGYVVDTYYWIGTFDKVACRFIPDDPKPRLFDHGKGIYTGQTGFCYITDEERESGITNYEDGHSVIISLAQGKSAGTDQNKIAGWAHNLAMPVEIFLADNGVDVIRRPVSAVTTLYKETLFEYSGPAISADELKEQMSEVRSDMYEIKASFTLAPTAAEYSGGIYVRYNPTENYMGTERSAIRFSNNGIYVDRTLSTLLDYVDKSDTWVVPMYGKTYDVTIYVDRSQLEIYINDIATITTRIYPKYGDSDYISLFDNNSGIMFTNFKITQMKGCFSDEVEPAYYDNMGNLKDFGN